MPVIYYPCTVVWTSELLHPLCVEWLLPGATILVVPGDRTFSNQLNCSFGALLTV